MSNVVVHAPPLPVQFGTYHSKAFMIEYGSGIRVVVHTANLIYVDCNNKSQGLWYQDFPPKACSHHKCFLGSNVSCKLHFVYMLAVCPFTPSAC